MLTYRRDEPQMARWIGLLVVVFGLHLAPLLLMTMRVPRQIDDSSTMAVDFDDVALAALLAEPPAPVAEKAPEPPPASSNGMIPIPLPFPEAAQPKQQPQVQKPEAEKLAAPKSEAEKKLIELDLPPLKPTTAFDESKTTKEAPKDDAYLSDRTSTAADRGPKDLPRGDPYVDKGDTRDAKFMQKRGEGNLPQLAVDANSGSVKKEGSPEAGKGPQDKERAPDRVAPLAPPALKSPKEEKGMAPVTEAAKPAGAKNTPAKAPAPKLPEVEKTETLAAKPEKGIGEADPAKMKPREQTPTELNQGPLQGKTEQVTPAVARDGEKAVAEQKVRNEENPAATAPKQKEPDELDAFKALLEGTGKSDGRGGDRGEKAGINAREGSKGHEGDGTLRPGHDEAVSDVTTVNLDSSAAEFGDARFAKREDEKSKYFKAAFRRIDGKWKAEIAARSRFRFERGVVTMKIVVAREGKLLEASEVARTPKGLGDEYVNIAKRAIQLGCDPTTEPFPESLQKFEKLECVINFIY